MRIALYLIPVLLLAACSSVLETPASSPIASATSPVVDAPTAQHVDPETSPSSQVINPDKPISTIDTAESPSVQQAVFPNPNDYTWNPIASNLNAPVLLTHAGDSSNRLFVIEQSGLIRIILDGTLNPTPFLDIRERTGSKGSEQGLLGLAFHPDYPETGLFYINYTDLNGDTVIAGYQVSDEDADIANPNSEIRLLTISQPYSNHNGGAVMFGPDGYLYLGLGDGGSAGDPQENAQNMDSLLGTILRLDVNEGEPYSIPADNSYANSGGRPEIWASGLRNPWRFSFDRSTGDLYIGDVGQNQWEEIDYLAAGSPGGANFGWNYLEGTHPFGNPPPENSVLIPPVVEYGHDLGCSVTGGVVYRGNTLPAWQGVYLYGDYCTGRVWGLIQNEGGEWENSLLFENAGMISSFGEDEEGNVYLVDHKGSIFILAEK
jgi:glucose/arabinose dehydrogenase